MLSIPTLLSELRTGRRTPADVVASVLEAADACEQPVWISRIDEDSLLKAAARLADADPGLPLYGIPFAVKDNIDVAGMPTTAGCPGFSYVAERTAPVVERLLAAGALLVGKTNMDQFATGLVGTRSPYGALSSVLAPDRISGGSSSGSAIAVATSQVAFSLGTDTAGSGRVPAACNGLVGIKPTRGLLSTRDVVPACASLDCVSVFAADVTGAAAVLDTACGFDAEDPWSRAYTAPATPRSGIIAVPRPDQLTFTEAAAAEAWALARQAAERRWQVTEVDIAPLLEAAALLYDTWIAERTASLADVIAGDPAGLDPTVAGIILGGAKLSGPDVFAGTHRLAALRAAAEPLWEGVDALLLPTISGHPRLTEVAAEPVARNTELGRYTNFVNLLDLAAIAVPGPLRPDGGPAGVTLVAPAMHDHRLLELAADWSEETPAARQPGTVLLAVVGAHMSGLELNCELTSRGGRFAGAARTSADYRLYVLSGDGVARPGLVRDGTSGAPIDAELWELTPAALGDLMTRVPAPLGIGRIRLDSGQVVLGFLCESAATREAVDITESGGWRNHLAGAASA